MYKVNIKTVLSVVLVLLIVLMVFVAISGKHIIIQNIARFSVDKMVKQTTIDAVYIKVMTFLILSIVFTVLLLVLFRTRISVGKFFDKRLSKLTLEKVIDWLSSITTMKVFVAAAIIYFVVMTVTYIYNLDIGADEGAYISSVKYFYETGTFKLPWRNFATIDMQLAYLPFFFLTYVVGYSVYSLRFVSLFYAIVLLCFLFVLCRREYSLATYVLLLILLVSDRTFVFVSSGGFGEIAALLALVLGFYAWSHGKWRFHTPLAALCFAAACLTKLQLLPLVGLVFALTIVFQTRHRIRNSVLLFLFCAWWLAGALAFSFVQGYDLGSIARGFWLLVGSSGQIFHVLPLAERVAHVNMFHSAFNVMIFSIVIFYYARNFRRTHWLEKMLFTFSCISVLWWVLCYFSLNVRNLVYAIVINYILFAIVITRYSASLFHDKKVLLHGSLLVFLLLNFVNGLTFHVRLARKEASDEVNAAIIGYETNLKNVVADSQQAFFDFINAHIGEREEVYCISLGYYQFVYTTREFIAIDRTIRDLTLPAGSYFVLTYLDYKSGNVCDSLIVYLSSNAELVFKQGLYEIYRIVE